LKLLASEVFYKTNAGVFNSVFFVVVVI